ncbi:MULTISPECIES: substrate-binding domain-containing protein [unclassified Streptomyces]|uniref:substrate-binding domain-containing protein n=1 Tax=unclassified Streptomyces TaxID=2593676 RepID=UPI0022580AFA|nr:MULTISPECIES: substrate-binding domain-containing protein [unclassified Streptomyces]MCX4527762.1 substrate-binding domain-containing protein [Streptomyces sp. NBC_01551]MCX4541641.1 substrate-binding domain-containing protein [Streptomyces sp. NBC_01565]
MRRILGIALAVLLIGGVIAVIVMGGEGSEGTATKTVRGVIGSEKSEYFRDPDVVKALADKGYTVKTETSGSWAMDQLALKEFDFAFPSSSEPAKEIEAAAGVKGAQVAKPFFSPLVVIARPNAAKVLTDNGLARMTGKNSGTLLMDPYLKAAGEDRNWQQLRGSEPFPELTGRMFIKTTDPATSNSGALFLAATSNVANNLNVVSDDAGIDRTLPLMRKLISVQGALEPSTDDPFRAFISGSGEPLILAYESQVASLLLQKQGHGDAENMVVLYPDTTVNSPHTFVPISDDAKELGSLLATDPKLRELAIRHGFRPQEGVAEFTAATAPHAAYLNPGLTGIRQVGAPTVKILMALAARAKE